MPTRPSLRFLLCLLPSLALVPLLPIYPRVMMTRLQMSDHAGDVVEWGVELCSVPGFLDDLPYMRPEQHPTANLAGVLLLAGALASILAFVSARWIRGRRG